MNAYLKFKASIGGFLFMAWVNFDIFFTYAVAWIRYPARKLRLYENTDWNNRNTKLDAEIHVATFKQDITKKQARKLAV